MRITTRVMRGQRSETGVLHLSAASGSLPAGYRAGSGRTFFRTCGGYASSSSRSRSNGALAAISPNRAQLSITEE